MAKIKIIDTETESPIPYANVTGIKADNTPSGLGATASATGGVSIDTYGWINAGVRKAEISAVGFHSVSLDITRILDGDVYDLERNNVELPGVVIKSVINNNKSLIFIIILVVLLILGSVYLFKK